MAFGIDDAIAAGLKLINKFVPDPVAKLQAEKELRDSLQAWDKMQTDVNVEEAKNPSIFVSGWRPFIGWTCGVSFAWQFIGQPIIVFVCAAMGHTLPPLPVFDFSTMSSVLFGMLGLAGARTYEKVKGVDRK